jgi:hypothetical protein
LLFLLISLSFLSSSLERGEGRVGGGSGRGMRFAVLALEASEFKIIIW